MTRSLDRFVPRFLKAIDRYLLLHRPVLWATRAHYVFFWGVLALILVCLQAGTQVISLHRVPNASLQGALLLVPALLAVGFWAWQAHLFNVQKHFGQASRWSALRDQLVFFAGILLLMAGPFVHGISLSQQIRQAVEQEELIQDLNALNVGDEFFRINPREAGGIPIKAKGNFFTPHFAFDRQGLLSVSEAMDLAQNGSTCQVKDYIYTYTRVIRKYSDYEFSYASSDILGAYASHTRLFGRELAEARQLVKRNLYRLTEAKAQYGLFQLPIALHSLFAALLFVTLAFWTFVQSNWKVFLGAGALLVGSMVFLLLGSATLAWSFDTYLNWQVREQDMLFGLSILVLGLLLVQAWGPTTSPFQRVWQEITATASFLMLPFIPFFSISVFNHHTAQQVDMYGSSPELLVFSIWVFGGCWLLWNLIFRQQLRDVTTSPLR